MSDQPAEQVVPEWEGPGQQVYANVLGINGGPFDVTLVFGLQQAAVPAREGVPPVTEVVRVSMSWGHAKSIIPLLAKLVAEYEEANGQVPSPGFDDFWKA